MVHQPEVDVKVNLLKVKCEELLNKLVTGFNVNKKIDASLLDRLTANSDVD